MFDIQRILILDFNNQAFCYVNCGSFFVTFKCVKIMKPFKFLYINGKYY